MQRNTATDISGAADVVAAHRKTLGLTPLEAEVYEMLQIVGPLPASQIAIGLDCSPQAVYRILNSLARRHFVIIRKAWPRIYEAAPLQSVIHLADQAYKTEQTALRVALLKSANHASLVSDDNPEVMILNGRQALYDRYVVEADKAKKEILVFAIGIAYDDQLIAVQEAATRRGVRIKHVVQRYDRYNYHVIKKWQRIGVKLRYNPASLGFHLLVFDARTVILSLSDPQDTERRTSMVMHNRASSQAMREYFYTLWATSTPIPAS